MSRSKGEVTYTVSHEGPKSKFFMGYAAPWSASLFCWDMPGYPRLALDPANDANDRLIKFWCSSTFYGLCRTQKNTGYFKNIGTYAM